ncbi:hypothetical protein GGQ99_005071 [Aminobacter niigataensis]|uniref:Uncharacterized protein n=1 Tax=Aminobacter niigataensis TaxID=83265 RepID=A0ABR6L9I4_9HYPH|nr:hypothetical protein [Aminobacter niigataensis]MBB4653286.1 hypothetical protein [Aminobacter niigataensis]
MSGCRAENSEISQEISENSQEGDATHKADDDIADAKKKGPAEAATSLPGLGSQSRIGQSNMDTNTTAAACPATVPYPAQSPIDEIDDAIACLRTIRTAVIADTLGLVDYSMSDAEVMIGKVLDQLDPIRTFLAEDMPFLECRRAWFARKGGAA